MKNFFRLLSFSILLVGAVHNADALTLSELRTEIRVRVKDVGTAGTRQTYSDTQLNAMINEAHRDIVNITWVIKKNTEIELVSGTTYYSLPTDIIAIQRVTRAKKVLKETTLEQRDAETTGWETAGGAPSAYFQDPSEPDMIGFYPWPNTSASTGTIKVHYFAQANLLSVDGDEPYNAEDRYQSYSDLIIYYVAYRVFLIQGQFDKANLYKQEYETRIIVMRERVGSKPNYNPGLSGNQNR